MMGSPKNLGRFSYWNVLPPKLRVTNVVLPTAHPLTPRTQNALAIPDPRIRDVNPPRTPLRPPFIARAKFQNDLIEVELAGHVPRNRGVVNASNLNVGRFAAHVLARR